MRNIVRDPQSGLPYAEYMNYWDTTKVTGHESRMRQAGDIIRDLGGKVTRMARIYPGGQETLLMAFRFDQDKYEAFYPVLPIMSPKTDTRREKARRQAAANMFYDIKQAAISFYILGHRGAFWNYALHDGKSVRRLAAMDPGNYVGTSLLPVGE